MGVGKPQNEPTTPRSITVAPVSRTHPIPNLTRAAQPSSRAYAKRDASHPTASAGSTHVEVVPRYVLLHRITGMLLNKDKSEVPVHKPSRIEELERAIHWLLSKYCSYGFQYSTPTDTGSVANEARDDAHEENNFQPHVSRRANATLAGDSCQGRLRCPSRKPRPRSYRRLTESSDRGKRYVTGTDVISWFHQLGRGFRYGQERAPHTTPSACSENLQLGGCPFRQLKPCLRSFLMFSTHLSSRANWFPISARI